MIRSDCNILPWCVIARYAAGICVWSYQSLSGSLGLERSDWDLCQSRISTLTEVEPFIPSKHLFAAWSSASTETGPSRTSGRTCWRSRPSARARACRSRCRRTRSTRPSRPAAGSSRTKSRFLPGTRPRCSKCRWGPGPWLWRYRSHGRRSRTGCWTFERSWFDSRRLSHKKYFWLEPNPTWYDLISQKVMWCLFQPIGLVEFSLAALGWIILLGQTKLLTNRQSYFSDIHFGLHRSYIVILSGCQKQDWC